MKLKILLMACVLALPVTVWAQLDQPHTRLEATFNTPVKVNADKPLPPGQYVFRQERTHAQQQNPFKVAEPDGKQVGFTTTPVKAVYNTWEGRAGQVPKSNMVMLKKVGNTVYLDYIWFQGMAQGYHFALAPEGSKGQEITVNAGNMTGTNQNSGGPSGSSHPSQ